MSQTCQERLWGKQFDTTRCQFDGERQTVQADTNLRDRPHSGACHFEIRPGRLRSLQEEGYPRILREGFALWKMGKVGKRQRRGRETDLCKRLAHARSVA